jgi:mannitol/fructose-specific phosphotransferase system IIA component (Ntr-type)
LKTLADLLTRETIELQATAQDWREAVRIGGNLLVGVAAVTPEYVNAMIRFTEELGPYVVIAPGLAIPHARPEEGVIELGFSLVTLATPVAFGMPENDPVEVLFSFGAPDKEAHIEALREVATLCCDQDTFQAIRQAERIEEVLALLQTEAKTESS